jgi:hypothetical protein
MKRSYVLFGLLLGAAALALTPGAPLAQGSKKQTVKAGKGEKVCRVRMQPSGEVRTWVCPKEVPCCVWHEINYVKCGTTFTGCL